MLSASTGLIARTIAGKMGADAQGRAAEPPILVDPPKPGRNLSDAANVVSE